MFPIILMIVLGALFGWLEDESFAGLFSGAAGGAILGFVAALVVGAFAYGGYSTDRVHVQLQNLVDNDQTHGSFFLGSGTIDDVPSYSWYERTANNSFERRDADAAEGTVHYLTDRSQRPYYVKVVKRPQGRLIRTWGLRTSTEPYVDHYDFYIPRGSITNEYKLDAK